MVTIIKEFKMENLYSESINKCNKSRKFFDGKQFFNTEEHNLKQTALSLLNLLKKNSIMEPNVKISNEEIKFYWSNENNNIDFIIREENIYKIKINTESNFILKKENSVFENLESNVINLLKNSF
jgi:hypothetical protein